MKCPSCGSPVPASVRDCPACQMDVGFPNVRAAELPQERQALLARLDVARVSAEAGRYNVVLEDFIAAVLDSRVVLCRSLLLLSRLASADTELFATYYGEVEGGSRFPEDNEWDKLRESVDSALFPNYHRRINFAALTLDSRGASKYGSYAIFLRDDMIHKRTTVFEENPRLFCERHRIALGQPLPLGYRATWADRNLLAGAKLHSRLTADTERDEYPQILLSSREAPDGDDFVEVHIFGTINRRAFERVVGPKPRNKGDAVLWRRLERQLREIGTVLEAV